MADMTALNEHNCEEISCGVQQHALHAWLKQQAKTAAAAEKLKADQKARKLNLLTMRLAPFGITEVDDVPFEVDEVKFTVNGDQYLVCLLTCSDCGGEVQTRNLTSWYQLGEWLDVGYTHRKAGAAACPSPPIKEATRS